MKYHWPLTALNVSALPPHWGRAVSKRSKDLSKHVQVPPAKFRQQISHKLREIEVIKMASGHTHPNAAALRTSAAKALEDVVKQSGFTPYSVSKSARDLYGGCRYYYFPKDLDKEYVNLPVNKNHVILMVDVDYYLDINHWLQYGNPILIYTFVPTTAGGSALDAHFTIADDEVTYNVSGGATYKHQVWDYRGDTVSVQDRWGNLLVYDIEQHILSADPTRRIVGFFPKAYVQYPYYRYMQEMTGVKRRQFNFDGLSAMEGAKGVKVTMVRDETAKTISVAKAGSPVAVTIGEALYTAVVIRHRTSKKPLISDVERQLNAEKVDQAAIRAAVLFELLVDDRLLGTPATTSMPCVPRGFQAVGPLVTEDGKPIGRAVAPSLVTHPAIFPVKSYNNDVASIEGRVVKMRNTARPPAQYTGFVEEFLALIIPEENAATGSPLSVAEVIEIQDRPSQRNRSQLAVASASILNANKIKAFVKGEAYTGTNDPRNISSVDTNHTLLLSGFTYAFKRDQLKQLEWYSPGKSPEEQCARLYKISKDGVILRDYSRFDGTISEWLQKELVRRMYMRWCNFEHRSQLLKLLDNEDAATGITAHGYRYQPGFSRKSGSPLTTDGNTVINAFNAYCAFRLNGAVPAAAWKSLGLYCGDDGVDRFVPGLAGHFSLVSEALGLKIELETTKAGEAIAYCGRIFCDPRTSNNSFQEPFRTLTKLHLTAAPPTVPDRQALANRAAGYAITDHLTPIIGPWCRRVLELCGDPNVDTMTGDERWKYQNEAWPQTNEELIRSHFCDIIGMSSGEVYEIEAAINRANSVEELPEAILENGHMVKHKLLAVLGHDIVGPKPDVIETTPTCSVKTTSEISQSPENAGNPSSPAISGNPSSPPLSVGHTSSAQAPLVAPVPAPRTSIGKSPKSCVTFVPREGAGRQFPKTTQVTLHPAPKPGPENPPEVIAPKGPDNPPPVKAPAKRAPKAKPAETRKQDDSTTTTAKATKSKKARDRAKARKAKAQAQPPSDVQPDVPGGAQLP